MSTTIKYAYLKQQTWLYRRNYPKHLQPVLGQALKQSLKTGDARVAKARVNDVNATYARIVSDAETRLHSPPAHRARGGFVVRVTAPKFQRATLLGLVLVSDLAKAYLQLRSQDLSAGSYKSVHFSVGLFASLYGNRRVNSLSQQDGQTFLALIAKLSPNVAKSGSAKGKDLKQLVALSRGTD
jgi:uncharacterized protein DUF6538